MNYIDYERDVIPPGNLFNFIMHKRKSFEHEREVRAVAVLEPKAPPKFIPTDYEEVAKRMQGGGMRLEVDLNALVENVYVSPQAQAWYAETCRKVAARYDLKAPVKQSQLDAVPLF